MPRLHTMKKKKLIIFTVTTVVLIILNHIFHFSSYFTKDGSALQKLKSIAEENFLYAGLLYLAVSIVGYSFLALPGVTFAIVAGLVFEAIPGTLLCLLASTIAAGISFFIGRYFLKDSIKPLVMKNKYLKKWIFESGTDKNYVFVLMLTRLVPIFPYNLQNFAYGVSDIPFSQYMIFSFLFMIPGISLYTFGISSLTNRSHNYLYLGLAIGIAVLVIAVNVLLKKKYIQKDAAETLAQKNTPCVSCKVCTAHCAFLQKYNLDFNDEEKLNELAYHCFLCGKCTEVCPHGVDGRTFMLDLRKQHVDNNGGKKDGYFLLQKEKTNYLFKNYKNGNKKTVLFPGCNYPSLYPKTLDMLIELCARKNIGTVFDCCGKPIAELGLAQEEAAIYDRLNERFQKYGIEEIITLCPNCYYHLQGNISARVTNIYEKLPELGLGKKLLQNNINIFLPCPDRQNKVWIARMKAYLPDDIRFIKSASCCGLGGCAGVKEPQLANNFSSAVQTELHNNNAEKLFVYCASCAGQFTRNGIIVQHLLNEILGSDEVPATKHSLFNRAKRKFGGTKK